MTGAVTPYALAHATIRLRTVGEMYAVICPSARGARCARSSSSHPSSDWGEGNRSYPLKLRNLHLPRPEASAMCIEHDP